MKKLKSKQKWVKDYEEAERSVQDLEVMLEFFQEGEVSEEEVGVQYTSAQEWLESLEFKNMLCRKNNHTISHTTENYNYCAIIVLLNTLHTLYPNKY